MESKLPVLSRSANTRKRKKPIPQAQKVIYIARKEAFPFEFISPILSSTAGIQIVIQ